MIPYAIHVSSQAAVLLCTPQLIQIPRYSHIPEPYFQTVFPNCTCLFLAIPTWMEHSVRYTRFSS